MIRRLTLALTAVALAACGVGDGPIFPVRAALYDWVTPDKVDPRSDRAPKIADPVVIFTLDAAQRSSFLTVSDEFGLGRRFLIGFDVRVPGALPQKPIKVSRFMRRDDPDVELLSFELDAERGLTFRGQTCVPADQLGDWNRVEARMRLSDRRSGYLEVFCNREPFWSVSGVRTVYPLDCQDRAGCNARLTELPDFEWSIGLISSLALRQALSIEMQRLHFRELLYVPNRIR